MAVVEVISGSLSVSPEELAQAATLLDRGELARSARFRFARDRRRFVVRRARLRQVMAAVYGCRPADLAFTANAYGKPRIVGSDRAFSAAHSGECWLVAVSRQEVGADCERIDAAIDWRGVAQSLFAPAETAALAQQPPAAVVRAFYDCWARKEAFVKALGIGLSYPLDAFEVSVTPDPALRAGGNGWQIAALPLGADHAAAVVVADDRLPLEIRHRDFAALS